MFALKAIDANRSGFLKKIFELNKNKLNYSIIVDGEIICDKNKFFEKKKMNAIYIVPLICGSGGLGSLAAVGLGFAADSLGGMLIAAVVNAAVSTAISLALTYAVSSMMKKDTPPQQNIAVGGTVKQIDGSTKSRIFGNKANTVNQGGIVPFGYGRSLVGSFVIAASIRSFPVTVSSSEARLSNPINYGFDTLSTQ
jgi:predicted phage tail protein